MIPSMIWFWRTASLLFVVSVVLSGCKATPPGKVETYTLTRAKKLFIPGGHTMNPVALNPANLDFAHASYSRYCNSCHGLDGSGTGVAFAKNMSPPAPSLASPQVQAYSDGQLKWIIENGLWPSGMPGAKGVLTDQQMWSIALYLRHLTPTGGLAPLEAKAGVPSGSATYVGSKACQQCHAEIYQR